MALDRETRNYVRQMISERKKKEMELDNLIYLSVTGENLRPWETKHSSSHLIPDSGRRKHCSCGLTYRSSKTTPGCMDCPPRIKARRERDRILKQQERARKRARVSYEY